MTIKKINNFKKQNGAAIFVVLIFLGFIFSLATVVAKIQIKELQFGSGETFSNMALFSADAGIERALYHIYRETGSLPNTCTTTGCFIPGTSTPSTHLVLDNGSRYHVIVPRGNDNPVLVGTTTEYIILRSIGQFHNIERSLEVNLYKKLPTP